MRRALILMAVVAVVAAGSYLVVAYALAPVLVRRSVRRHPALAGAKSVTRTSLGLAGDPLNIALVATEARLVSSMVLAGWDPADPVNLASSVRIAESTLRHRPYEDAPVSALFLDGRQQDLAFEQEVGHDARQRHHVRFWSRLPVDEWGRRLWIGSATFDSRVGFSHHTGQVTHHIAPDLDTERDKILRDLEGIGAVGESYFVDDFQQARVGRNGGGDPYKTDGRLAVVVVPND